MAGSSFDPNSEPGYESDTSGGGVQYLGNVPHARRGATAPMRSPFGGPINYTVPGYKKGDQVTLLPSNGGDLAALQQALYQAGYLTDAQYSSMVLGSPDEVTTLAFSKLLATANMSGVQWKDALASRLAAAAQQAPEETRKLPPLEVTLDNPEDIKAVAQETARSLYGGNLPDADLENLVASYQGAQRAQQTAAYNQRYDVGAGDYGGGGETTAPESVETMTTNLIKNQHHDQYMTTQIGTSLTKALDNLRTTGYL